jgi:hypothetical protein
MLNSSIICLFKKEGDYLFVKENVFVFGAEAYSNKP